MLQWMRYWLEDLTIVPVDLYLIQMEQVLLVEPPSAASATPTMIKNSGN